MARKSLLFDLYLPVHWFLQVFPYVPARHRLLARDALQYQAMCAAAVEPQLQLRHTECVAGAVWLSGGSLDSYGVDDVFNRQRGRDQAKLQVFGAEAGKRCCTVSVMHRFLHYFVNTLSVFETICVCVL